MGRNHWKWNRLLCEPLGLGTQKPVVCAAVVLIGCAGALGQGKDPVFEDAVTFPLAVVDQDVYPFGLAAADIDNDGDIDLAVACLAWDVETDPSSWTHLSNPFVAIHRNTGDWSPPQDGFAGLPATIGFGPSTGKPSAVAFADFTGDFYVDLIVATSSYFDEDGEPILGAGIYIFENDGTGGFSPTPMYSHLTDRNSSALCNTPR